jgi:tetratricopeptide (TPR) repeat protein
MYFAVLRAEPANAEALSRLGILAAAMQKAQLSIRLMRQAAALRPDVAAYHVNLGEALRANKEYAEAETAYRASLRINPLDAETLGRLGYVLAQQNLHGAARAAYTAALDINPTDIVATRGLALLPPAGLL